MIILQMQNPRERLREITKAARTLDRDIVRRAGLNLEHLRDRLAGNIARAGKWEKMNLRRQVAAIETAMEYYQNLAVADTLEGTSRAATIGSAMASAALGEMDIPPAILEPHTFAVIQDFQVDLIRNLSADIRARVLSVIRLALLSGRSLTDTMKAIDSVLGESNFPGRAEAIARTEINRALNLGEQARVGAFADQNPDAAKRTEKFWIHTNDDRTRPDHRDVGRQTNPKYGGKTLPLDEDFEVGGESANGPYDPRLSAAQSINCRCRLGYHLTED
jgi:hypothetical protein